MTTNVIKENLNARNLIFQGNKPDLLLRPSQAIEANVTIITGSDPHILDNMAGTGFAPIVHWKLMVPDDSDVVTEEGAYHASSVPAGDNLADVPRKKN